MGWIAGLLVLTLMPLGYWETVYPTEPPVAPPAVQHIPPAPSTATPTPQAVYDAPQTPQRPLVSWVLPYRVGDGFRCPTYIRDEFFGDIVIEDHAGHIGMEAGTQYRCLVPGGIYNPTTEGKIHITIETIPTYLCIIDAEVWIGDNQVGGSPYPYSCRAGWEYTSINQRGRMAENYNLEQGIHDARIVLYGQWPAKHFCDAWREYQRDVLGWLPFQFVECRGMYSRSVPEYNAFLNKWYSENEIHKYEIPFKLELRW